MGQEEGRRPGQGAAACCRQRGIVEGHHEGAGGEMVARGCGRGLVLAWVTEDVGRVPEG